VTATRIKYQVLFMAFSQIVYCYIYRGIEGFLCEVPT
jgi:hypothetical protein